MKYYIIAGEASGDLHGANLMRAILVRDPQAEIRYWGGDRMAAVGGNAQMVKHIRDLAIMGFVEVLLNAKTVLNNLYFCKMDIMQFRPDAVVFIDYPGFNLKIAKFTHERGFRNYYYISPQVWAWKQGRLKAMRRDLDKLCYILPSERKYFASIDFPQAQYVGHPLLDEVRNYREKAQNSPLTTHHSPLPTIALLPGSRKQELRKTLPSMMRLARRHPEYQFVIAGMSLIGEAFYQGELTENVPNLSVVYDQTYALLSRSYAAVVCSGTATLETALFRVPQVVCYKGNAITVGIAALLIKAMGKLKYISLVNLIADEPIVKELIQGDVNDASVEIEFQKITKDEASRSAMLSGYDRMIDILGNEGASDRTAAAICGDFQRGCACTVGMFDGVHVGHRHLLERLRNEAVSRGLRPLVVTFDRHPKLALGGRLELLMNHDARLQTLRGLGFEVEVVPFTPEVSGLSACEFAQEYLVKRFGMKLLVLGYDNRFGNRQRDDFSQLDSLGFEVIHDEPVAVEGITVSSTQVRRALQEGRVEMAEKLLSQPYSISGKVVHGRHIGSEIGFPTANVQVDNLLLPQEGVYAVQATVEGMKEPVSGMANIGPQPTFGSENKTVEVNLFTDCGELYGREISLSFVSRLRDVRKFDSPEALVEQLKEDKHNAIKRIGALLVCLLVSLASWAQPDRVYRSLSEVTDPALVYRLDLHKQKLREFPPEVFTFSNLEELNLSRTRIHTIPDSLHLLPNLRILNLSRNPILDMPPSLAQLTRLEELILYLTGVVSLPPECKSLNYTLKLLDLRSCPMTFYDQEALDSLLPTPKKRWNHVCNCQ